MYDVINYIDCTLDQQREILALRNHDEIRMWMVNPDIISEQDHILFIEGLHGNSNKLYFAIFKKGDLVGTYNLIKEGEGIWERGIIAKPSTQGKGQTELWEKQIIDSLSQYGINTLLAKVKINNHRSIRYHEKMGFTEINRDKEYIYYKRNL